LKRAFMRNVAPSLMENGCSFSFSNEPGCARSMMMSSRPATSRPSDRMITLRGSDGSALEVPEPRPSEAFHLLRDSSFWSVKWERCGQTFCQKCSVC
jgi:hypothetical protein